MDKQMNTFFYFLSAHGNIRLKLPKMKPKGFFPADQDLADISGRKDFHLESFQFPDFLDSRFLDFQIPGFPDSQIS